MADLLGALDKAYKGSYINSSGQAKLYTSTKTALTRMMGLNKAVPEGESPNVLLAFTVLCVASAGQNQKKMEKCYNDYDSEAKNYKKVCKYSQEAATKQQQASDDDKATKMSAGMVHFCKQKDIGYSKEGKDYKHDKDEWQSLRDNLDYEKSKASTDLKMAASKFDTASKDYDSAVQGATKGVKDHGDLFSKLSNMS